MAIAYVGGATASTGSGTATTLTVTYSSGANALFMAFAAFVTPTSTITSITDSASNTWVFTNLLGSFYIAWANTATVTPITSVVIHASTATNICAVLGEYSGVTTVNIGNATAVTSAASPVTLTKTITANNWLISSQGCQTSNALPVFSSSTGNLRNQATMTLGAAYGFAGVSLTDNTSATTSVTTAATFTNTYLTAVSAGEEAH